MSKKKPPSAPDDLLSQFEWHDSILDGFELDIQAKIIIANFRLAPDEYGAKHKVQLAFLGVLRIELEWLSDNNDKLPPISVVGIHLEIDSDEALRWKNRLASTRGDHKANVYHVVIEALQFLGWGENSGLQGINIICRSIEAKEVY